MCVPHTGGRRSPPHIGAAPEAHIGEEPVFEEGICEPREPFLVDVECGLAGGRDVGVGVRGGEHGILEA